MTAIQAQVEVFLTAFHALPDAAQREILARLFSETQIDIDDAQWNDTSAQYSEGLRKLVATGLAEIDTDQSVPLSDAINSPFVQ